LECDGARQHVGNIALSPNKRNSLRCCAGQRATIDEVVEALNGSARHTARNRGCTEGSSGSTLPEKDEKRGRVYKLAG
jgi:hypothetical protein